MLVYQRVASNQSRTAGFGPGDTFDKRFKLQVWEIAFWEPGWEPGLWLMWLRHGPKYQVEVIQTAHLWNDSSISNHKTKYKTNYKTSW